MSCCWMPLSVLSTTWKPSWKTNGISGPDHGLLRNEGVDPVEDAAEVVALDVAVRETGTVIVADVQQVRFQLRRQVDRRIDGQIAALGVSAQVELLPRVLLQDLPRVVEGFHLGRDVFHEGHVEVFLPAHQRGVRTAVRDVQRVVRKVQRDGRELDHRVGIVVLDEV